MRQIVHSGLFYSDSVTQNKTKFHEIAEQLANSHEFFIQLESLNKQNLLVLVLA